MAAPQTVKDFVNILIKLSGKKDTKMKCIGLRDGEPMY
jgi:FlaA1/EpsC-like NDP-sugar epimerase